MRIRPHESDPKPFRVLQLSTYTVSAVVQGLDDGAPTAVATGSATVGGTGGALVQSPMSSLGSVTTGPTTITTATTTGPASVASAAAYTVLSEASGAGSGERGERARIWKTGKEDRDRKKNAELRDSRVCVPFC